ncbi:hypothetical protein OG21DRAFT_656838 [Imleria badia]|nr:hypothetical protein OG21DRAFT_656838 [Imleria badia]
MLHSWTFCARKLKALVDATTGSPSPSLLPTPLSFPSASRHTSTRRASPRKCQFRLCLYFATALLHQVSCLRQCCPVHSCFDVKHATYEQSWFLMHRLCESEKDTIMIM